MREERQSRPSDYSGPTSSQEKFHIKIGKVLFTLDA